MNVTSFEPVSTNRWFVKIPALCHNGDPKTALCVQNLHGLLIGSKNGTDV